MFLTTPSILHLPTSLKPHPSPFLHGAPSPLFSIPKSPSPSSSTPPHPSSLTIHAMKKMQGRVVCATNDKTIAVEVVRLAPHPKYKRRIRLKKKYQVHDPENMFKVGDFVQLEKCRPISKTKTFTAIPVAPRNAPKPIEAVPAVLLDLPLQSQEQPV